MPTYRNILVPTDFSDPAREALEHAIDLAQKYRAKITLLHVFQMPVFIYAADVDLPARALERRAADALAEVAAATRARWPDTEHVVVEGVPWEQILEVSKERGVDLVVMGTHGRRGVSRAFLGSVAEKVIRTSEVPVLTVRAPEEARATS